MCAYFMAGSCMFHSQLLECQFSALLYSEGINGIRSTRRARAKSLDNVQQTMTHGFISHKGSIKTNFFYTWTPDSQLLVWLQKKLSKIGHRREDYSLFLFHKKSRFRKYTKKLVKSKYPSIPLQSSVSFCSHCCIVPLTLIGQPGSSDSLCVYCPCCRVYCLRLLVVTTELSQINSLKGISTCLCG